MRENSLKNNAPTLKNKSRICLIAVGYSNYNILDDTDYKKSCCAMLFGLVEYMVSELGKIENSCRN